MAKKIKKPKIAIIGLTSCEGCQFAILDLGKRFLSWIGNVVIDEFRLIEDQPETAEHYDICFVEGTPITKENIKLLKAMRKKSDWLVVLGNCAALGGVWEIKNYRGRQKAIRQVYQEKQVANADIKEVDNFVKVDLTIPGCPINGDEFMELVYQLLAGKIPKIDQSPVCYECQANGYECLLQRGEICLGPITLGGCEAVCLKSKQACWGCRGIFTGAQLENFIGYLMKKFPQDQVYRTMEVFGVRDTIMSQLTLDRQDKSQSRSKKPSRQIKKS